MFYGFIGILVVLVILQKCGSSKYKVKRNYLLMKYHESVFFMIYFLKIPNNCRIAYVLHSLGN